MSHIVIDARKIKSSTGRYVYELVKNLESLDRTNRYTVIVLPDEIGYYVPKAANFKVIAAPHKHYTFGEQIGFAKFLYSLKPDLVHFYMPQQPLAYTRAAVTTVHDLNLIRITENDMNPLELFVKKKIFAALLRQVAKRSKHIIAPTHYTKDDLVQWAHIDPGKVTVTYEGVYHIDRYKSLPQYESVPYVMYLGRGEPYKNNRRMIEAHQQLLKTHPKLRLVICGAIDELRQADVNWVKDRGYTNIDFLGWTTDEQAAWLYKHCRAYIAPSYLEGFGLPALEAMGQGAPVVSANTTCSPEVLGDAAYYFDPFSVHDMARSINEVLTDNALRKKMIIQGRTQVKKYSWARMAEQTLTIYKNTLKQP
jgi:glycosyltransferase involved in cell wall biosynthesis